MRRRGYKREAASRRKAHSLLFRPIVILCSGARARDKIRHAMPWQDMKDLLVWMDFLFFVTAPWKEDEEDETRDYKLSGHDTRSEHGPERKAAVRRRWEHLIDWIELNWPNVLFGMAVSMWLGLRDWDDLKPDRNKTPRRNDKINNLNKKNLRDQVRSRKKEDPGIPWSWHPFTLHLSLPSIVNIFFFEGGQGPRRNNTSKKKHRENPNPCWGVCPPLAVRA